MKKRNKRKPYRLGQRSAEVQRLDMLEGTYPEDMKVGQPSQEFIANRNAKLRVLMPFY